MFEPAVDRLSPHFPAKYQSSRGAAVVEALIKVQRKIFVPFVLFMFFFDWWKGRNDKVYATFRTLTCLGIA